VPPPNSTSQRDRNKMYVEHEPYKPTRSVSPDSAPSNAPIRRKKDRKNNGGSPYGSSPKNKYKQPPHKNSSDSSYDNHNKSHRKTSHKTNSRTSSNVDYQQKGNKEKVVIHKNKRKSYGNQRRSHSTQNQRKKSEEKQHRINVNEQEVEFNTNSKRKRKSNKRKKKLTYDEEMEAKDDIAPLENDRIGAQYDEHGNYDKFKNRAAHKEEIRMALEAFPSQISAGTTGTAEMNFVGTNYREYNAEDQQNSYFKEDYEHKPLQAMSSIGTMNTDNLSLGNLDSGTTMNSVTTISSSVNGIETEPAKQSNVNTITSPQYNNKYMGQHQQYQGRKKKQRQPKNIKIINAHNNQQEVAQRNTTKNSRKRRKKQQQYNHNMNDIEESPTVTYTSPSYNNNNQYSD